MYFLGIETGGSKSTGVLTDTVGSEVRVHNGPPGNISVLGQKAWTKILKGILDELLSARELKAVQSATLGVAGAGRAAEKQALRDSAKALGLKEVCVMTDAELFHYSVHGDESGMVLIAGTGSVCLAREKGGVYRQFGGWGYLLGDEGSGYALGRAAIRVALAESAESRGHCALTQAVFNHYGVSTPSDLVTAVFSSANPQKMIASSARLVCDYALQDDATALECIHRTAESLQRLCVAATTALSKSGKPFRIGFGGGLLHDNSPVKQALEHLLSTDYRPVATSRLPAVAGVMRALLESGHAVPDLFLERVEHLASG